MKVLRKTVGMTKICRIRSQKAENPAVSNLLMRGGKKKKEEEEKEENRTKT